MTDPTEIEKIVLEVLEKYEEELYYRVDGVYIENFPNVAREVAERITNENRR